MKKSAILISFLLVASFLVIASCTKTPEPDPCNGLGVLNIENKLDSAISVKIMETHDTKNIEKDYTLPFSLAGNQPYTLAIDGPKYHKDTTIMLLFCDNQLFIVSN